MASPMNIEVCWLWDRVLGSVRNAKKTQDEGTRLQLQVPPLELRRPRAAEKRPPLLNGAVNLGKEKPFFSASFCTQL
ncbi:unnamed protein product, partial [Mesorhabditis spiculigera]